MDSKVLVLDRQLQGGDWGEFQMRNNFHLHQWAPSQSPAAQSRMNAASGAKAQMTEKIKLEKKISNDK